MIKDCYYFFQKGDYMGICKIISDDCNPDDNVAMFIIELTFGILVLLKYKWQKQQ